MLLRFLTSRFISLPYDGQALPHAQAFIRSMIEPKGNEARGKGAKMARQRERACLEQGLKLDLVKLAGRGFIQFGGNVGPRSIQWKLSGEVIGSGVITADMSGSDFGWLQINMDNFQQCVELILMPRHFGGGQWYFVCSELNQPASVLWRPPGALFFRCRQYWGRRAAYLCQFGNPIDRAHIGRAKLKAKLCSPNLDDWSIPQGPRGTWSSSLGGTCPQKILYLPRLNIAQTISVRQSLSRYRGSLISLGTER